MNQAWVWFEEKNSLERRNVFLALTQRLPEDVLFFMTQVVGEIIDTRLLVGLPGDVILHLMDFLDVRTLCRLQQVCRRWHHAAGLDQVWRRKFQSAWQVDLSWTSSLLAWSWKKAFVLKSLALAWQKPTPRDQPPRPPQIPSYHYLVGSVWWEKYQLFSSCGTPQLPFDPTVPLPPVSSLPLLDETNTKLLDGLHKNVHYQLLREDMFKVLYLTLRAEVWEPVARCTLDSQGRPEAVEVFSTDEALLALFE